MALADFDLDVQRGDSLSQATLQRLLGPGMPFRPVNPATALTISVNPCSFVLVDGTIVEYAGGSIAITDDDTRYLHINSSGTLVQAAAMPTTAEIFMCGVVIAASGAITSVKAVGHYIALT